MMKKIYESPSIEVCSFDAEPIMAGRVARSTLSVTTWSIYDGALDGLDQIED